MPAAALRAKRMKPGRTSADRRADFPACRSADAPADRPEQTAQAAALATLAPADLKVCANEPGRCAGRLISRRSIRVQDEFDVGHAVDEGAESGGRIGAERRARDDEQPARVPGGAAHQPVIQWQTRLLVGVQLAMIKAGRAEAGETLRLPQRPAQDIRQRLT